MSSLLEALLHINGVCEGTPSAGEIPERTASGGCTVTSSEATMPYHSEMPPSAWPIVKLRATGDGTALARALARVLVRRALVEESAMEDCADHS
jgi:hypothetical protein